MNHVPNDTLEAVDTLGRNLPASDPTVVDERLRSGLRVRTECGRTALDAGTAPATFRIERPAEAETLRGHRSFVTLPSAGSKRASNRGYRPARVVRPRGDRGRLAGLRRLSRTLLKAGRRGVQSATAATP